MTEITNENETRNIFEKASDANGQTVPAPICIVCSKHTGYIEDDPSPSAALILGIVDNFEHFQLDGKLYIRIRRCVYCDSYSRGRYPAVFQDGSGELKLEDFLIRTDLSKDENYRRHISWNKGRDVFNSQFLPKIEEPKNKRSIKIKKDISDLEF